MASSFFGAATKNMTANALVEQLSQRTAYNDYVVTFLSLVGITGYLSHGKLWDKPDPFHHIWFERPQQSLIQDTQSKETRNIAQKLEETNKDVVIFWGSQSGTAEGFAHRVARECHRRFKLEALVADLSDYDSESIVCIPKSKLVIFIMSTYGEGDPSDNASEFWDWIRASSVSLSNLRYAAFGLGNTNYKFYNKVIDVVVEKLEACHATQLLPVGKADDANSSTEEDFLEWKDQLLGVLQHTFSLREHEQEYEPVLKVVEDTSLDTIDCHLGEPISQITSRKTDSLTSAISALKVKQARWLTEEASDDRRCLHMEMGIDDHARLKYKTGDHLAVYPTNPKEEVERLLTILNLESRKHIPLLISSLDTGNNKTRIPSPTTLSALFTSYLEICAPVSRETAQTLISFAPSHTIKTFLLDLTADKDSYAIFLSSTHITLSRLMEHTLLLHRQRTSAEEADWSHLPLSFVLESFKPMTPRLYSISSSAVLSPQQLSITVSHTPTSLLSRPEVTIPGLTSSYLSTTFLPSASGPAVECASISDVKQPQPQHLYASIIRSNFKLPLSATVPLILIGTGTGIAPLRAFLHERSALASMGRETGPILFIYGCRNEEGYLYRREIEDLSNGPLKGRLDILVAFSRPTISPSQSHRSSSRTERTQKNKKTYVQDLISEPQTSPQIAKMMLEDGASIYFCGSTRMARDAGAAVMTLVATAAATVNTTHHSRTWSEDEVLTWRDERRRVGKWKEDVWG